MNQPAPDVAALVERLAQHPVFGQLDGPARAQLAGLFATGAFPAGATFLAAGQLQFQTCWLLSGAATLRDPDLGHGIALHQDDLFGFGVSPSPPLASWEAVATGDCVLASLAPHALQALCLQHRAMAYYFPAAAPVASAAGAAPAPGPGDSAQGLLGTSLRRWVRRTPVSVPADASIQQASCVMRDQQVSAVLLVEHGRLLGLMTDRDLRNRVVAPGLDTGLSVSQVATWRP